MWPILHAVVILCALGAASFVSANDSTFTGEWEIDLRAPAEKRAGTECGGAGFKLTQSGNKVTGSHWMVTPGCGRQNEGGDGTVTGVVRGDVAILTVTSARNGEMVRGRATREGPNLRWHVSEELKAGELERDSGLILYRGLLRKAPR